MAAREHKVSRRVLLAAACAAPILSAVEGPAAPLILSGAEPGRSAISKGAVTKWDQALTRYRQAEAALAAAPHADDATFDRLLGQVLCTLKRLLRTPAPHLPALATKLDLLVAHEAWELTFAAPSLAALRQDARRLAAAHRI